MTSVVVEVPGKVMLAGEYSVLTGGQALAATVDRHLKVKARRRAGLGEACLVASNLWDEPRLIAVREGESREPLVEVVQRGMALYATAGIEIAVTSELDVTFGIGSSSALRLGVLLAFEALARLESGGTSEHSPSELWSVAREAWTLQDAAQAGASGYDIATQLVGGVVAYSPPAGRAAAPASSWPGSVTAVGCARDLNLWARVYIGGRGAPTGPLVQETRAWLTGEDRAAALDRATERLLRAFRQALSTPGESAAIHALAAATGAHRTLLAEAPRAPRALIARLASLTDCDVTWSFKTTGAGGEDALLVIGREDATTGVERVLRSNGWRPLEAPFSHARATIAQIDEPRMQGVASHA